jgi:hypothetical protein
MVGLARFLASRPRAWGIVLASLAVTALSLVLATRVEHDDDLLAFLPETHPEVRAFHEINRQFGSLDVAIVGIETKDPFDATFLETLAAVTKRLEEDGAIHYALSLANVEDFRASAEGGIETDLLARPPKDAAAKAALERKVMAKDLVVGKLVSKERDAVLIYCFAAYKTDPKVFAANVRSIVSASFPGQTIYWGGAPFISTYIYSTTQEDLRRLTPWAVAVIILMTILTFRDLLGAMLALVSTGMGIGIAVGAMGLFGVDYNLVMSSMPVILFACGSAYPIHILARHYQVLGDPGAAGAPLERTLAAIGPTVLAAGLTTVGGLLSFLAMDMAPMRTFGLYSGIGILATLILSMTFVPAVIVLLRPKARSFERSAILGAVAPVVELARRRRGFAAVVLALVTAFGVRWTLEVDSRMDQTAFFVDGSPPERADRFLLSHFGGSTFLQARLSSDFSMPEVLLELERIGAIVEALPSVSSVQHVGQVLATVNEAIEGSHRIPDDREQVLALFQLLEGNRALGQLLTPDRRHALLTVQIRSNDIDEIERTLASVEDIVARELHGRYRMATGAEAADRRQALAMGHVRASLRRDGIELRERDEPRVLAAMSSATIDAAAVEREILAFLASDECVVSLEDEVRRSVARAIAEPTSNLEAVIAPLVGASDPEMAADLASSLAGPVAEMRRREASRQRARALLAALAIEPAEGLVRGIGDGLLVLDAPGALVADAGGDVSMSAGVNGLPVLHRALSESSTRNNIASLAVAMALVMIVLAGTFRSMRLGLLASVPMTLTLLVVYGGMGWFGVRLDIGTSMLASLIIGTGVDYAVHFVAAAREERSLAKGTERTGPAIWTNALMVAAGFYVLTLGEARPLQNVGGLTAAAMLTAALATFLAIPTLGRRLLEGASIDEASVPAGSPSPAGEGERSGKGVVR